MKKKSVIMRMGVGMTGLLLLTGCMPRIPTPQALNEQNTSLAQRAMWQDTSSVEDHYSLKPEPYSLESGKKDPELLGPQSTLQNSRISNEIMAEDNGDAGVGAEERFIPRDESPSTGVQAAATAVMTRSKCIRLIGKAKYDDYTKQFGSETAALRKCTILQRVQK